MSMWNKEQLENMLEDVVNELDLSESAIDKHGPHGTPPADLVNLVLAEKDMQIKQCQSRIAELEKRLENTAKITNGQINVLEAYIAGLEMELAEREEWYESLMEYCVKGYYKCVHCGGPVANGLCCAWCGSKSPDLPEAKEKKTTPLCKQEMHKNSKWPCPEICGEMCVLHDTSECFYIAKENEE